MFRRKWPNSLETIVSPLSPVSPLLNVYKSDVNLDANPGVITIHLTVLKCCYLTRNKKLLMNLESHS